MYPDNLGCVLPLEILEKIPFVFDTVYNPYETLTVRMANYFGNRGIGGLNMLVEQAVKAQEIFNGIRLSDEEFDRVLNKAKEHIPPFEMKKNIILIGPPGCGKTTISREISTLLSVDAVDIDEEIEKKENRSISEIFLHDGEEYFRALEKEVLFDALKEKGRVISTGGGLPEFTDLSEINREENVIIYINASEGVIFNRIKDDTTRPLLKDGKTALLSLLKRRTPIYEKSCDIKINVEKERNIKAITREITENLF